jgi:sugar phosphate permease
MSNLHASVTGVADEPRDRAARTSGGWYRWIVLGIIFFLYMVATADRANFGMALPYIKKEYGFTNAESGILVSLFFTFYAIFQIPFGFLYKRISTRILVPMSILATSISTWLIGTTSSLILLKLYRACLGLAEAPLGIGCGSTINRWFPPKEKGTAMGIYFAAMKFGPVVIPPICGFIILTWGWREVFTLCAIPGMAIALVWYFMVHDTPKQSPFTSEREAEYIAERGAAAATAAARVHRDLCPVWVDTVIRTRRLPQVDTGLKVFTSWNIIGSGLAFMCMSGIINTIMAWIPTYLITEKHFGVVNTGFIASAPFVGSVLGNMVGGFLSDRVFGKRRKPMMIVSAVSTSLVMYGLVYAPNDSVYLAAMLFLMGFLLTLGYSAFVVYPMGLTTKEVYPVAYGLVNTGGSVGAALAPLVVGFILDSYKWDVAFLFLAACSFLSLIVVMTIAEPKPE